MQRRLVQASRMPSLSISSRCSVLLSLLRPLPSLLYTLCSPLNSIDLFPIALSAVLNFLESLFLSLSNHFFYDLSSFSYGLQVKRSSLIERDGKILELSAALRCFIDRIRCTDEMPLYFVSFLSFFLWFFIFIFLPRCSFKLVHDGWISKMTYK